MKPYLAAFAGTVLTIFLIFCVIVRFDFGKFASRDYWLSKPHSELITKCDLGDIVIMGDSTSIADIIPSRIGAGVRDVGFNGGTPVEAYSIAKSILQCSHRPKAVIVSFVPGELSADPENDGNSYFWGAFKYNIVDLPDALEVLKVSRKYNDAIIAGPKSLFDIDFRVKAFLYSIKFPPYYSADLEAYVSGRLQHSPTMNRTLNLMIYNQTVLDEGHHFIGTSADGAHVLDDDVHKSGNLISPVAAFYMRRMIETFAANGIAVYFVEPPRNRTSAILYFPSLIDDYQNYLLSLQLTEPNFHVINNGFNIWDPVLFGDRSHLNLRGALILSHDLRKELNAAGDSGLTDPDTALEPANLYDVKNGSTTFWSEPASAKGASTSSASGIYLPNLQYPGTTAWLYKRSAAASGDNRVGIEAPAIDLEAKTNYAASVFVKDIDAGRASLQLNWPGGTSGRITFDFGQRQISYAGMANPLNSGATICPGGWFQLFISGVTGPEASSYAGPVVALPANKNAAVYLSDISLEKGLWPTNYCPLAPGEAQTIPLPQIRIPAAK